MAPTSNPCQPCLGALLLTLPCPNRTPLHTRAPRYTIGQRTSDNPEEEKKQKAFQGILNKITPDNFERLTNKVGRAGRAEGGRGDVSLTACVRRCLPRAARALVGVWFAVAHSMLLGPAAGCLCQLVCSRQLVLLLPSSPSSPAQECLATPMRSLPHHHGPT